jgi:parallel beta-helix repeat protein
MRFPNRFIAAILSALATNGAASACEWRDASRQEAVLEILNGDCAIPDLLDSEALDLQRTTLHVVRSIVVKPGAALTLSGDEVDTVWLHSGPDGFANIIAEGALLQIENIAISSHNPEDGRPDTDLQDGRSFIRVESFLTSDGAAASGRLEVTGSTISYLGYDSRFEGPDLTSTYGLSLKVLSESQLRTVSTTGFIRTSDINNNYRGFYSYGASGFVIEDSRFFENLEYGVDGHDDTDNFTVKRNEIFDNGGTGLICSRRCNSNMFVENTVYRNGANGIMLHDLSNMGVIKNNLVRDNRGDGIVVHDSHSVVVKNNDISGNRIGVRVFAGSINTTVVGNRISESSQYDISLLEGDLATPQPQDPDDEIIWNGRNLARHNDSRVWFTVIETNVFSDDASIRISGAVGVDFRNNQFLGHQKFRISNSQGTQIDGGAALPDLPAPAGIVAPDDASLSRRISTDNGSPVVLDGDVLQVQLGSGPFYLKLALDGTRTLTHDETGVVRTTEVVRLPIAVRGGSGRILTAHNRFERRPTLELMLTVEDGPLVLSLTSNSCQTSEWKIDGIPHYALKGEAVRIKKNSRASLVEISCINW